MKNNFFKSILSLSLGSAVAQFVAVLTPLVLIKLYSPASVGEYSFVVLSASIMSIFFTLRSENLLMAIDDDTEAEAVVSLSIKSTLVAGSILQVAFLGLYFLGHWPFFSSFVVTPLVAAGMSLFLISRETQVRNENYMRESALNSSRSIVNFAGQFALGLSSANSYGLIIPKIITDFYYSLSTFIRFRPKALSPELSKKVILKYKSVCLQLFSGRLLLSLSNNLLSLYWPFFFSFKSLGLIYLSLKITQLPGNIIGENLSKVFEKFFIQGKITNLKYTLAQSFVFMLCLSCIASLVIYFFLDPVISIIGNKEWLNASYYSLLFSPIIFTTILSAGLTSCFKLSSRVFTLNIFDLSEGVIKNLAVVALGLFYSKNASTMILTYSLMTFAFCILKSAYVLFKIPSTDFKALSEEP